MHCNKLRPRPSTDVHSMSTPKRAEMHMLYIMYRYIHIYICVSMYVYTYALLINVRTRACVHISSINRADIQCAALLLSCALSATGNTHRMQLPAPLYAPMYFTQLPRRKIKCSNHRKILQGSVVGSAGRPPSRSLPAATSPSPCRWKPWWRNHRKIFLGSSGSAGRPL